MTSIQERLLALTPKEKTHYKNFITLLEKAFDLKGEEAKHEALKRVEANRKTTKIRSTKSLNIR